MTIYTSFSLLLVTLDPFDLEPNNILIVFTFGHPNVKEVISNRVRVVNTV